MATIADLLIKIGGDSANFRKELNAVKRQIKTAFGSESIKLSEKLASKFKYVGLAMAGVGVASVSMSSKMAMTERAFGVLTGSSTKAKEHLEQLEKFAAETPFEFEGLTTSSKKLQAYGFQAEAVIPILTTIGDASMAVGLGQEGIDRVTVALGQMNAKGKVSAEEMKQLAETGLPVWQMLADKLGVSVAQAMDMSRKSAISAKEGIGALLTSLSERYGGMMKQVRDEIPQSFSNMQDSVKSILRSLGKDIIETFDLKTKFANAASWLQTFSAIAKNAGIKEALSQMIPDSIKTSVVGISAAILGVAVPAFAILAVNVIAATWPLLAIGAAFGTAAALIYSNWDSVGPFWTGLWNTIVSTVEWAWNVLSGIFSAIADAVRWVDVKVTSLVNKALAMAGVEFQIGGKDTSVTVDVKGVENTEKEVWSLKKALDSMKGSSLDAGKAGEKAAAKAAKAAESAAKKQQRDYEALCEKAKDTSERIEDEWIQMTGTKMDVLEKWYSDELKTLGETKSVNENYQRDLTRLEETYSEKRRQILNDEAKERQRVMENIKEGYSDIQRELASGNLRGSALDVYDMSKNAEDDYRRTSDFFAKITAEYADGTEAQKKNIIDALGEAGVEYTRTEEGRLDFSAELNEAHYSRLRQLEDERLEYYRQAKDIQSEIDQAYNERNFAMLQESLSAENAERLSNSETLLSLMETYEEIQRATHATTAELMSSVYGTAFDSLSSNISELFMGTKSLTDAMKDFGKAILQVVADYFAKKIAGMLLESTVGKAAMAAQTAVSSATAATMAAAWAPAAAAVSLATMGANSAPAMAGISATHALSTALSIPGLAEGGFVTGPTIAQIGEGRYNESVIQDSSAAYSKIAKGVAEQSGNNPAPQINLTVQAMDTSNFEEWLERRGGRVLERFMTGRRREFATIGGIL